MNRVETITDGVIIYLGDCRDIVPTLPRPDAVLADPPYGIEHEHKELGGIEGDDEPFDPRPFLVGKHHILWGANHYASRLSDQPRWLMWLKHDPGLFGKRSHAPFDLAWTDLGGSGRALRHIWDASIRQGEWFGKKNVHPHQKPVELYEWCLGLLPKDSKTILDPFMGSGSAGVACVKRGYRYTGVEIKEQFFDVACWRIEAATKQTDLFIEKPKPTEQIEMLCSNAK